VTPFMLSQCSGKQPYSSRSDALRVIRRMLTRHKRKPTWCGSAKVVTYKCTRCGKWHIGNDVKGGAS